MRSMFFFHFYSATEIASGKKRKTILPADIISALNELDFDDMVETLNGLLKCEYSFFRFISQKNFGFLKKNFRIFFC
jgi:hypothetical protein